MKQLFAVGIGGGIKNANIEVHDVQFVVADAIEDTYEILKKNWYGDNLHMDEYAVIEGADGYRLSIEDHPLDAEKELYFIYMGGYAKEIFGELHQFGLFAASDEAEAREKGKKELLKDADESHVDRVRKLNDCIKPTDGKTYYIHLIPDGKEYCLKPDWSGYLRLI
ncbi:DUF1543 domain-containing protein [Lacrimispora sp. JR3]|uniref:DUF1543 domain-containing protein n=1 Tax=Lacrimispora sinapis TaxID=3111456 RepID=UPI003749BFC7